MPRKAKKRCQKLDPLFDGFSKVKVKAKSEIEKRFILRSKIFTLRNDLT